MKVKIRFRRLAYVPWGGGMPATLIAALLISVPIARAGEITTKADANQSGGTESPSGQPTAVTAIEVASLGGQTLITWHDAATGPAGAQYRYSVYRSKTPITEASLKSATLIQYGILNNSALLFDFAFSAPSRIDPTHPMMEIDGGKALPRWSGITAYTVMAPESAYYAVVATDLKYNRVSRIVPGENATTAAIDEKPGPLEPIEQASADNRPERPSAIKWLGEKNLPLVVQLHASQSTGGGARNFGDYYQYFGDRDMGYRDGMPSVFSVAPAIYDPGHMLELFPRDTIVPPNGIGTLETDWFGYYASPQWAASAPPRAYPFTENRVLSLIGWVVKRYSINPDQVYASGYSMGGWGTATFALRHPEVFAAVFPEMPAFRPPFLWNATSQGPRTFHTSDSNFLMPDGESYAQRIDMVHFVETSSGELPFLAWSIGRQDGVATWKEQVDMVHALVATHRGFAFAWNNGNHGAGTQPMDIIWKYYPPEKFRRDESYPAFSHSSIDDDLGNGDPADGTKEGGINLGFNWTKPVETDKTWSVELSNVLTKNPMTVDVTPRRAQKFKPPAGATFTWHTSSGQSGNAAADSMGNVTIHDVKILSGKSTNLTIQTS